MNAGEDVLRQAALRRKVVVFETFVHRKSAGYTNWAYSRLYSWDDAREAANVAFYRIYVRWDAVMAGASPDAFSFKILRDAVVDVLRKRDRCPLLPVAVFEESVRPVFGVPGEEVEQAMVRLDVHQAVERLPDRQRTCVFLGDILGCSVAEIADTTGLACSTVRSHLAAGRAALAIALRVAVDEPIAPEDGSE